MSDRERQVKDHSSPSFPRRNHSKQEHLQVDWTQFSKLIPSDHLGVTLAFEALITWA
jgi:hypothetical protein